MTEKNDVSGRTELWPGRCPVSCSVELDRNGPVWLENLEVDVEFLFSSPDRLTALSYRKPNEVCMSKNRMFALSRRTSAGT